MSEVRRCRSRRGAQQLQALLPSPSPTPSAAAVAASLRAGVRVWAQEQQGFAVQKSLAPV